MNAAPQISTENATPKLKIHWIQDECLVQREKKQNSTLKVIDVRLWVMGKCEKGFVYWVSQVEDPTKALGEKSEQIIQCETPLIPMKYDEQVIIINSYTPSVARKYCLSMLHQ